MASRSPSRWRRIRPSTLMIGVAGAFLLGCEPAPRSKPDQQAGIRGDTIVVDRGRCLVPATTPLTAVKAATRCAELFVVRNGYTDLPPVGDTTQWVPEPVESEGSAQERIQSRRRTLEPRPIGLCRDRRRIPGYVVFFRPTDPENKSLRGVTMNLDFTDMRMEHQDFGTFTTPPPSESGCVLFRP